MGKGTGHEMVVDVDKLTPNPWNPNKMSPEMYAKELNSLRRFGFVSPIIIRTTSDGTWQIIDGEHRWRAAMELGITKVPVWEVGRISDPDAKQLTIALNRLHGEDDPQKLRDLLRDLATSEPLPALLEVMPWSKAEFSKLAELPEVDWNALDDRPSPKAGTKWVERIYRMPPEVAHVLDEALAKAKSAYSEDARPLNDVGALEVIAADYLAGP